MTNLLPITVYDEENFVPGLVLASIKGRCQEDKTKKNINAKRSVNLPDYKVVQPKVSPHGRTGAGRNWKDMGETHEKTTMFRLEWSKWENGGTEEQRLKELDALLAAQI